MSKVIFEVEKGWCSRLFRKKRRSERFGLVVIDDNDFLCTFSLCELHKLNLFQA